MEQLSSISKFAVGQNTPDDHRYLTTITFEFTNNEHVYEHEYSYEEYLTDVHDADHTRTLKELHMACKQLWGGSGELLFIVGEIASCSFVERQKYMKMDFSLEESVSVKIKQNVCIQIYLSSHTNGNLFKIKNPTLYHELLGDNFEDFFLNNFLLKK